tara:strand:+ start:1397 stop:10903 length:9507 start_codon:yes stop_codon:yes gene_type:complete
MSNYAPRDYIEPGEKKWYFIKFKREKGTSANEVDATGFQYNTEGTSVKTNGHQFVVGYKNGSSEPIMVGNLFDSTQTATYGSWAITSDTVNGVTTTNGNDTILGVKNIVNANGAEFDTEQYFTFFFNVESGKYYWFGSFVHAHHTGSPYGSNNSSNLIFMFRVEGTYTKGTTDLFSEWANDADMFTGLNAGLSRFDTTKVNKVYDFTWNLPRKESNVVILGKENYEVAGCVFDYDGDKIVANATKQNNYVVADPTVYDIDINSNKLNTTGDLVVNAHGTGGYGFMALTICEDMVVVALPYNIKWYRLESGTWTEKGTITDGPKQIIKCKLKKSYDGEFFLMAAGDRYAWMYYFNASTNAWIRDSDFEAGDDSIYFGDYREGTHRHQMPVPFTFVPKRFMFFGKSAYFYNKDETVYKPQLNSWVTSPMSGNSYPLNQPAVCAGTYRNGVSRLAVGWKDSTNRPMNIYLALYKATSNYFDLDQKIYIGRYNYDGYKPYPGLLDCVMDNDTMVYVKGDYNLAYNLEYKVHKLINDKWCLVDSFYNYTNTYIDTRLKDNTLVIGAFAFGGSQQLGDVRRGGLIQVDVACDIPPNFITCQLPATINEVQDTTNTKLRLLFTADIMPNNTINNFDFIVRANGSQINVSQVEIINGDVIVTLQNAITKGQTVTLSYTNSNNTNLRGKRTPPVPSFTSDIVNLAIQPFQGIEYSALNYNPGWNTDFFNLYHYSGALYFINNNVHKYDIANDRWSRPSTSTPAYLILESKHSGGFIYNDEIYTHGYSSGFKMDKYNIDNNSWTSLTTTGAPKHIHRGVFYNNEYYSYGGTNAAYNDDGYPRGTTFYKFNPGTNAWTTITLTGDNLPSDYAGFTMDLCNNEILIYGGTTDTGSYSGATNDLYKINIDASTITKITTTGVKPIPTFLHTSYIMGNELYVLGGVMKYHGPYYDVQSQSRILDLTTNVWRNSDTFRNTGMLSGMAKCIVGQKVYLFSGGHAKYEHTPTTRNDNGSLLLVDYTPQTAIGNFEVENLVGVVFLKKLEFIMPVNTTNQFAKVGTEYKNGTNGRCYNIIDRYNIQYASNYDYWNTRDIKVWPTFQFPSGYSSNSTNWDILDQDGVSQKSKILAQALQRNGHHVIFNYAFNITQYKPINPNCGIIGEGVSIDEIDMFGLEGSWNDYDNDFAYVYYVNKDTPNVDASGDTVDVYIKFLKDYKPKYWAKDMYEVAEDPDYYYLFICTFKNIVGNSASLSHLIVFDTSKEVKETETPVKMDWGPTLENAFISYGENYKIILTFDTIIETPDNPTSSAFTVKINGATTTINSVTLNSTKGFNNEIQLNIAVAPSVGDTVTISYDQPTIIAQRFGASDTRHVKSFTDYPVIVQGFKNRSEAFIMAYAYDGKRYSHNLFLRASGYNPNTDIHYLGSINDEYKVGNYGHPYMTLQSPIDKYRGSFLGNYNIYNQAGEFKNNFLTFPSNWFQIGSELSEPAGFDAHVSSTYGINVIYPNAGIGPVVDKSDFAPAGDWDKVASKSHYVILWNRVKEGYCYFTALKTAPAWQKIAEQHRQEMPGDNDYYYLFMFKFVGRRADSERYEIQGLGDLYEFFANHTTYKTDHKNLNVFQATSPTNVFSILRSPMVNGALKSASVYYHYPDGTSGTNTGIEKRYQWETYTGEYPMPRVTDTVAPAVAKAVVHNTNHQQLVVYFDEELKFGLDLNPEDFIVKHDNVVNPVNTLKYESNILILNLNSTIVINEVVTLSYVQKYTAGTRNIMDYLGNIQSSFENFVVENNAGVTAVLSSAVVNTVENQKNVRLIELTFTKNFLKLSRYIKNTSFELKVNNKVNEIAVVDVPENGNVVKLYYEDIILKNDVVKLTYTPDENFFFKLKDTDRTPTIPLDSIDISNNSEYELQSEIVIQPVDPNSQGTITLGPLGLELGFRVPMLDFVGESDVNVASKHYITDISYAVLALKWNTDAKAVRNGYHHACGNFWSSANNNSSNFASGEVGITTTKDILWITERQISNGGWNMNDVRVKIIYVKQGVMKELHLFFSLNAGVDWFKWNVLTSTGTTASDDITTNFQSYSSSNITQNNLLHVYVVSPTYPKRQKIYKRMVITPGGNDFVWPPDMSGVTQDRHYKFDTFVTSSWLSLGSNFSPSFWSNIEMNYPGDGYVYPVYFPSISNYYLSFGMLAGFSCFHQFYNEGGSYKTAQLRGSSDSMGSSSNIKSSNSSGFLAHDGRDNLLRYNYTDMLEILDPKMELYFWAADADSYFNKGHIFFSLVPEEGKKKQYYEWNVLTHKDYGSKPIFHGYPVLYEQSFPGPFDFVSRSSAPGYVGTLDQFSYYAEWYNGANFHGRQNAWTYQGYGIAETDPNYMMEWKSNFKDLMGPSFSVANHNLPGGGRMTVRGYGIGNTTDASTNEIINGWDNTVQSPLIKQNVEFTDRLPELFDPGIPEKPVIVKIDLNENDPKKLILYFTPEIIKGTPRKQDFRVKLNNELIDFSSVVLTELGNIEINLFNRILEDSPTWPQKIHVTYIKPSIVDFQIGADIRTDSFFDKKVNNNINLPEPVLVVATVENSGIADASLNSVTNDIIAADISANESGVFEIAADVSIKEVENDNDEKKRNRTVAFVTKIIERLTTVTQTSTVKFESNKGAVIKKEVLAFPEAVEKKIKQSIRIFPTDVIIKTQDVKEEETIYVPIQENQSCTIRVVGIDYRFSKRKVQGILKTIVVPSLLMPDNEFRDTFDDGETVNVGGHLIIFGSVAVQAEPAVIHIPVLFTVNGVMKVEDTTTKPSLDPIYDHRHRFNLRCNFLSADIFKEAFSFKRARSTFTVTIVDVDGEKKYAIDGDVNKELFFKSGITYTFDLSYNTAIEPAFKFSKVTDGKHSDNNSIDFTTGITESSNPPRITVQVPNKLPGSDFVVYQATSGTLYYYGSSNTGMGGKINVGEKEALFLRSSDASMNAFKDAFKSDLTTFSTSKIVHDVSWGTIRFDEDGNKLLNSDGTPQIDISFGYVQTRNGVDYLDPITSIGGNSLGDVFLRYVATHLTGHPLGQAFIKNDTQFIDDINGSGPGQARVVENLVASLLQNLSVGTTEGEYNDVLYSIYSQILLQQRARIGVPSAVARPFPLLPNDNIVLYIDGRVNLLNDSAPPEALGVQMKDIFPQSSFPYMNDETGQLNAGVWMVTIRLK